MIQWRRVVWQHYYEVFFPPRSSFEISTVLPLVRHGRRNGFLVLQAADAHGEENGQDDEHLVVVLPLERRLPLNAGFVRTFSTREFCLVSKTAVVFGTAEAFRFATIAVFFR